MRSWSLRPRVRSDQPKPPLGMIVATTVVADAGIGACSFGILSRGTPPHRIKITHCLKTHSEQHCTLIKYKCINITQLQLRICFTTMYKRDFYIIMAFHHIAHL